jgi:quinol monooxygenase YgiN
MRPCRLKKDSMPILTVIATLRAKPGKEAELKDHLTTLVGHTRTETGCISYDLNQRQDDPAIFVMVEHWTGRSALDQHLQMPYMREFADAAPALLAESVDMQLLDMLSTPKR